MDVRIGSQTYNSSGASFLYADVGDLLAVRLGDHGPAVREVERNARLPHAGGGPANESLRDMWDRYNDVLIHEPPRPTFRRKRQRLELTFSSSRFTAADDRSRDRRPEHRVPAAEELRAVLPTLKRPVKKADDFDVAAFLAEADAILASVVADADAIDWESNRQQAHDRRQRRLAAADPWDLLEIDWDDYHPQARAILDDPWFWNCVDDFAPHGNDTGADLLAFWVEAGSRDRADPMRFLEREIAAWPLDVSKLPTTPAGFEALARDEPLLAPGVRETYVALAFACLKVGGDCPAAVRDRALLALDRADLICDREDDIPAVVRDQWRAATAKLRAKLA